MAEFTGPQLSLLASERLPEKQGRLYPEKLISLADL